MSFLYISKVVDEIGKLIQLLTIVIESLEPPSNQQRNQLKMTPRSMHRRLGNPLGNVKSLVNVLKAIYRALHSAKDVSSFLLLVAYLNVVG